MDLCRGPTSSGLTSHLHQTPFPGLSLRPPRLYQNQGLPHLNGILLRSTSKRPKSTGSTTNANHHPSLQAIRPNRAPFYSASRLDIFSNHHGCDILISFPSLGCLGTDVVDSLRCTVEFVTHSPVRPEKPRKRALPNWARTAEQRVYQRLVPPTPAFAGGQVTEYSTAFPGCQNSKMRFPPARFSSTHHGRNRHGHHAMPHDRRDSGNDPRVRGIHVQGTRESCERPDLPSSSHHNAPSEPAQDCGREGSRGRGSDAIQELAPRDSRRDNDPLSDHLLPRSSTPDQSYHDLHLQPQKQSSGSLRRRRRRRRESIPPDRESHSLPVPRDYETTRPAVYPPIEVLDRRPPRSRSPSIRKQQRSLSPSADESRPKRRRQDSSLRRSNRAPHTAPSATYAPRPYRSPPPRDTFLTRREYCRRREDGLGAYTPPLPDRGRSPSPRLDSKFAENPNLVPLGQRPSSRHDLYRSPPPALLPLSRSQRRTSPLSQRGRRPTDSYIDISRRQTPESAFEENSSAPPPLRESFRSDRQELFPSHNQRRQDRHRSQVEIPDLASGANSVDVNMSARGNFRGNHGGRHYNQGAHDSRNYAQSSSHATPNSSVQGSPPAQSSHSGGRGSWNGQK